MKTTNWLTNDVEELLISLDSIRQDLSGITHTNLAQGDSQRLLGALSLIRSQLDYYTPEPEALRKLRWYFKQADYEVARTPVLPTQTILGFSAVSIEQLAAVQPYLDTLNTHAGWVVSITPSEYSETGKLPFFDIELNRQLEEAA